MIEYELNDSEIIYIARSKKFGIIGYLIIDRLINGRSFGGIRIVSDISLLELQHIARAMTYKNAFVGNRIGGAKAAIIINKENEKYRKEIIEEFGRCISSFIKHRMYFPGMDMGITIHELQLIFDSAGCRYDALSWKNLSHEYTAYSCFFATMCALEKKGKSIKDTTFSIQGFGNVGSIYANIMCKEGARFVAFSNQYCGLISDKNNGFNGELDKLIQERSSKGDAFILTQPKDRLVSHSSILEKDVTVLLPSSKAFSINSENWKRVNADIIVCAANAPMSYETERLLFNNGKIVITDFVANCGGILGSAIDNYVIKDVVLYILSTSYKRKIESLLSRSTDLNKSLADIVIEDEEKIINKDDRDIEAKGKLIEYILPLLSNPILYPIKKITDKYIAKQYISRYCRLWEQTS